MSPTSGDVLDVVRTLQRAMDAHDLDACLALFAEDYDSVQPAHPDRAFRGTEQVRANWGEIFAGVGDLRVDLLRAVADGDTAWTEWRWHGTHRDGSPMDVAGVALFGVRDGLIASARIYMESVEQAGAGIEAAVAEMAGTDAQP